MKNILLFTLLSLIMTFSSCNDNDDERERNEQQETVVSKFSYTKNKLTVSFLNESKGAFSYFWDFGDGTTSTETNPVHKFRATNVTYTVSLKASTASGTTDTYKQSICIVEKVPQASFSTTIMNPLTVVLSNASTNAVSYLWDFGDGTTSTLKEPTHKYKSIGVYKITLTVYNDFGKSSSVYKNVTVELPTKCYFAGLTYQKLSVNNKYISFVVTDDDLIHDTYVSSTSELISTANMPYQFTLSNKKLLSLTEGTYVIKIYYQSTINGDKTLLDSFTFSSNTLNDGTYPDGLYWRESSKGNKIKCQFIWE